MIRLMVICQAFRMKCTFVRWRQLAQLYPDVDVTLIGPKRWETKDFGALDVFKSEEALEEERFRVISVDMVERRWTRGGWDAPELFSVIKKHRPNFIYIIGEEGSNITFRMALARRLFVPDAKICAFTMRGMDFPFHSINFRLRWRLACAIYDAYFCHYPRGAEVLRAQGRFTKPIYMQTQVGVDSQVFRPDANARREIRNKWGLRDEFVFGSLSRIDVKKGLLDILNVLPLAGNSKFMMIGDGPDMARVQREVSDRSLDKYVIFPGYIPQNEPVAAYLNALDGFVHIPQILPGHLDTFPLAVVQAMATGLPIIGADSGGVPYQLGGKGVIVPLQDPAALKRAMNEMAAHPDAAKAMGEALRARVMNSFEIRHLTECFNCTMREIMEGRFNPQHADQQDFVF